MTNFELRINIVNGYLLFGIQGRERFTCPSIVPAWRDDGGKPLRTFDCYHPDNETM